MEKLTETQIQELRKQNEEKKEYLQSYKQYHMQAKRLQEQLEELRLGKMSPKVVLSDMPSAHSRKDLSDYMAKYEELEGRILRARKRAVEKYSEVQMQIERMENENEKTVLTLRYLRGYKWERISDEIGVGWTQIHKIHGEALKHFKVQ